MSSHLTHDTVQKLFLFPANQVTPKALTMFLSEVAYNLREDGTKPKLLAAFGTEQKRMEIVKEYFSNTFCGHAHCQAVSDRALEILSLAPGIVELNHDEFHLSLVEQQQLLSWGAILHDIAKFAGHKKNQNHEEPGSLVAEFGFRQLRPELSGGLMRMIQHHDFFCSKVDGHPMPPDLRSYPLAENLRLADRTSVPPDMEVLRWWHYGRHFKTVLFDKNLEDSVRFGFRKEARVDQLTFFMMIFALQPEDFFYGENRKIFSDWARGKSQALSQIVQIFCQAGCQARELVQMLRTMERFHRINGFEQPVLKLDE